jgi:hypothetical protein
MEQFLPNFLRVVGDCSHCNQPVSRNPQHDYMVTKEVWALVHPEGRKGFLHDTCLVDRAMAAGLQLSADSFTSCLCFVNRHIHLPRPQDQMQYLVQYFAEDTAADQQRRRPHFGYVVAQTMLQIAEADRLHAQPNVRPSCFQHLFKSAPHELGTEGLR